MYRAGELLRQNHSSSATSVATNDKLKQKKRLSFREPEVETQHSSSWSNSNRIQSLQSKPSALLAPHVGRIKHSTSLEDLNLEDQTFIIAQHVGQAFDKKPCERRRQITAPSSTSYSDSTPLCRNSGFLSEALQNDRSHIGNALQKNSSSSRVPLTAEDSQCFDALSPPLLNMATMKFPAIEDNENRVVKPNQALVASTDVVSTSVQHQMQFLKYQLEQQRQQTQAALAHIQLLKDQLQAETSARYKAQTQNHQLIIQNKELLDHIQSLFRQIQDLEKLLQKQDRQPSLFTAHTKSQITETLTKSSTLAQKNNEEIQSPKITAFAPNTVMANRRSSLTGLKPFQPKSSYLESNSKRDEVQLSSRGSSPTSSQIRNLVYSESSAPESTTANKQNGEKSFLYNNKQRYFSTKDSSGKEEQLDGRNNSSSKQLHNGLKDSSTRERESATKSSENLQVSSIPLSNLASKNTTKIHSKPLVNSELSFRDETLVLNENPFLIEERSPTRREVYTSRKNHSSDLSSDNQSGQISSLSLSPKSYTSLSKSSKPHKNDSMLPLSFDCTDNLCKKENKKFSQRLFNS